MRGGQGENIRVAMVSPGWPVEHFFNGIVSYTTRMKRAMEAVGASVTVLADPVIGEFGRDVVRFDGENMARGLLERLGHKALKRMDLDLAVARSQGRALGEALRRLGDQNGLDVVQIPDAYGWSDYVRPASAAPVVVRLHGPWFLNGAINGVSEDGRFRRRVRREGRAIAAAWGVTAPSESVLASVRAYYGLELRDAAVIANPVEPAREGERWRLEGCERGRVLFVGRFDRHKGADVLIEAFGRLAERRPEAALTFVGPDHGLIDEAGRRWGMEQYLNERVSPAVRRRIEVLGRQPQERIEALRRRSMVTVVASRYETFGNVAIEAMNLGCPVVCSRVGGLAEIVEDGVTGLTFESGDAAGLASVIERVLGDGGLAAELGERGRRACETRFSPQGQAQRTLAYYQSVCTRWGTVRKAIGR